MFHRAWWSRTCTRTRTRAIFSSFDTINIWPKNVFNEGYFNYFWRFIKTVPINTKSMFATDVSFVALIYILATLAEVHCPVALRRIRACTAAESRLVEDFAAKALSRVCARYLASCSFPVFVTLSTRSRYALWNLLMRQSRAEVNRLGSWKAFEFNASSYCLRLQSGAAESPTVSKGNGRQVQPFLLQVHLWLLLPTNVKPLSHLCSQRDRFC
jgi:hypothetical protein